MIKLTYVGDVRGHYVALKFTEDFKKGDVITYDPLLGQQFIYLGDHRYQLLTINGTINKNKLIIGEEFIKIGYALSEFSSDPSKCKPH